MVPMLPADCPAVFSAMDPGGSGELKSGQLRNLLSRLEEQLKNCTKPP
jgi:hypothetical protein